MASQSYLPRADQDLLTFAENMNAKIAPDPTLWGLSVPQQTAFDILVIGFASAMAALQDPLTRSSPYVTAKNEARRLLIQDTNGIRKLVDIIHVYPGTTNQMRSEINITIRSTSHTAIPAPTTQPVVRLKGVNHNTVYFFLRDFAQRDRRGKPNGVAGASIMTYVGNTPPNDFSEWTCQKMVTRTTESVTFPVTVAPLSKVWIAAAWMNAKGQIGPYSSARWTNLAGGVSAEAA
ncbi:MAG: hypothetical protein ACR2GY_02320 [Phycisphaerales bacterium]